MIEPAHRRAATVIALRDVLQRRSLAGRRFVAPRLVVELEEVPVRIAELVGGAVAEIAVAPADAAAERFDRRDAACERLRTSAAIADVPHAGVVGRGQLQRVELVVVEAAEIRRCRRPGRFPSTRRH